jgi:HlyD family secretion protein
VAAADAARKLQRAGALSEKLLMSAADLETANVARQSADAQVQSAEAAVTQSTAALAQAEVTRDKTVIAAPIDGIVIARNVDVGQTVAASMEAPTLFVIAADLREMRLNATIDESDVGTIRAGQHVDFRVGAYPDAWFTGTVEQLRLNAVVVENVVTYTAMIAVPNAELKLKPGMTATLTVEIDKRSNVMRVPNAALQYRPAGEPRAKGPEVWIESSQGPTRVALTTGMSDGTYTEVQSGTLSERMLVITGDRTAAAAAEPQTGTASGNPFAAAQQRPPFPRN